MELTESQIEEQILYYLNFRLEKSFAWKVPSSGYFDANKQVFRKQVSRFAQNGKPDIDWSYKNFRAIEVKTPKEYKYLMKHYEVLRKYAGPCKKKNHLRDQIHFIEKINSTGNIAFFADSVERVKEKIKEHS